RTSTSSRLETKSCQSRQIPIVMSFSADAKSSTRQSWVPSTSTVSTLAAPSTLQFIALCLPAIVDANSAIPHRSPGLAPLCERDSGRCRLALPCIAICHLGCAICAARPLRDPFPASRELRRELPLRYCTSPPRTSYSLTDSREGTVYSRNRRRYDHDPNQI